MERWTALYRSPSGISEENLNLANAPMKGDHILVHRPDADPFRLEVVGRLLDSGEQPADGVLQCVVVGG